MLLFLQLCLGVCLPLLCAVYAWSPPSASEQGPDIVAMPRVAHLQVKLQPALHEWLAPTLASWLLARAVPVATPLSRPAHPPCSSRLQHLAAPHVAFFRTLRNNVAAGLSKGTAAADGTVHALLHRSSGAGSRAAGAYLVVSLCWVLCKRLAGVYAIC